MHQHHTRSQLFSVVRLNSVAYVLASCLTGPLLAQNPRAADTLDAVEPKSVDSSTDNKISDIQSPSSVLEASLDSGVRQLGVLYGRGQYEDASELAETLIGSATYLYGEDSPKTANFVNYLGILKNKLGLLEEAEAHMRRVLSIRENSLGPTHPDTCSSLSSLGCALLNQGRHEEARVLLERAASVTKESLGETHPATAHALTNLSALRAAQGDYKDAERIQRQVLAVRTESHGRVHPETAASMSNLAASIFSQRQSDEAVSLLKEALEVYKVTYGPESVDVASVLRSLGTAYTEGFQFDQAQPALREALRLHEKIYGNEHPETAESLDRLGCYYLKLGQQTYAEPLFVRALRIRERRLGAVHPKIAESLNRLGAIYFYQSNWDAAESAAKRCVEINEVIFGKHHPEVAGTLNYLGEVYRRRGDDRKAEEVYRRALDALRAADTAAQRSTEACVLCNLSLIYSSQKNLTEAKRCLIEALQIEEQRVGPDHPDVARILKGIAYVDYLAGDIDEAALYSQKALEICDSILGCSHPDTVDAGRLLAQIKVEDGKWIESAEIFDRSFRGSLENANRVLLGLSSAEQATYIGTECTFLFHQVLSLALTHRQSAELRSLSAGWLANGKSIGNAASAQRAVDSRLSNDPQMGSTVRELTAVRAQLASLSQSLPKSGKEREYRGDINRLVVEESRLIRDIGEKCQQIYRAESWVDCEHIRRSLPSGSVFVDIARFLLLAVGEPGQSRFMPPRYAAWIIPAAGEGEIQVIDLGSAEEIEEAVFAYRSVIASAKDAPSKRGLVPVVDNQPTTTSSIAQMVMQPIEAAATSTGQRVNELVISPDGALWLLPWAAMRLQDNRYAIEKYDIRTVTSARDLITPVSELKKNQGKAVIIADPSFDSTPEELAGCVSSGELAGKEFAETSPAVASDQPRKLPVAQPLPGTRIEAEAAVRQLRTLGGESPDVYLGVEAQESILKKVIHPKVLSVATHGFFLQDQSVVLDRQQELGASRECRPATSTGDPLEDPLLRCGLLLAGVNTLGTEGNQRGDDGILTGLEIVGLDLSGTELVVLSACETGVGKVRNGEGVAGLRQAFRLAGARSVVATLWKIPDEESAQVMSEFYKNLASGMTASRALRASQLVFIESQRKAGKPEAPYLWAAYGVTGE